MQSNPCRVRETLTTFSRGNPPAKVARVIDVDDLDTYQVSHLSSHLEVVSIDTPLSDFQEVK